jgi:cytochrome c biogenesis protein CcdA
MLDAQSITILLGAAVVDSINPCAFGVLIFLLTYLSKTSKKGLKLLTHGLAYILAVFLTYLIAGLLLMPIIGSLGQASVAFYGILGTIIIILGLVEVKDFFWYQKGFSLELLPGASKRIKLYVKHISGNIFTAFGLGVFVALVELPCTGAVYLAVLSMMALIGVNALTFSWLIIYNIIFVLPLVGILFAFYKGTTAESLETWRTKNRKWMRLLIGGILIFLGAWMIQTAYL